MPIQVNHIKVTLENESTYVAYLAGFDELRKIADNPVKRYVG